MSLTQAAFKVWIMRDILTIIGTNPTAYVSLYLFHPMKASTSDDAMKAITYSMDALVPGLYIWFGPLLALRRRSLKLRLGGSKAEEEYSGTIHSSVGMALVLPGYRVYTTYQGSYDPR
jgi:hypothetical protein